MNAPYWPEPVVPFDERRRFYLEYCASHSAGGLTGFFSQIARLELGLPVDAAPIYEAIKDIDSRHDCSDFAVAGLLRLLYGYGSGSLLPATLKSEIEACLLRFKYWWDEPGDDRMCYFTENHQILFHSAEYLAGHMLHRQTFSNRGCDGAAHVMHATPLLRRWMRWRAQFGFSEWLSNCYIDEDLLALLNLYDFAADINLRRWAGMLIDVLLFEMALHSYRGVMGCTHGRTYAPLIKGGRHENTANVSALAFGVGMFNNPASLSGVAMATSRYRCPPLITAIACDTAQEIVCRERQSLDVEDAERFGVHTDSMDDLLFFWSAHAFHHPRLVELSQRAVERYRTYPVFAPYDETLAHYRDEIARFGRVLTPDGEKAALTEVNIETVRTPAYLLSCAQDYRSGKPGCQQHIWQATLGLDAVIFTNNPGAADEDGWSRPNFWAGNGVLPRAAQHRNVLACVHNVPADDPFPWSHAYLPRAAFDEVVERGNWLLARHGDGFAALYSQHPARWASDIEVRVDSPGNVWLCEMGTRQQWGDFDAFVQAVATSTVTCEGLQAYYKSPSLGWFEFGWQGPLRLGGQPVSLRGYTRFDNPYCRCEFTDPRMIIRCGKQAHEIDLADAVM